MSLVNNLNTYSNIYFLGIGGIGMSALARYFKLNGLRVAGYDKTPSPLTDELINEGISIHFDDFGENIPEGFNNKENTLVVLTPAIPSDHGELEYFLNTGFEIKKRAEVLGLITESTKTLAVAGTHGKTTTSCMLAHILNYNNIPINAFLGGISTNLNSNYLGSEDAQYTIVEADEFDRSFLKLSPYISIITSTDADHLDIYSDKDQFLDGFKQYVANIDNHGSMIAHISTGLEHNHSIYYGEGASSNIYNLRYENAQFLFDATMDDVHWKNIELGIPGIHNAENALACILVCRNIGLSEKEIREGLRTFKGVYRRFQFQVKKEKCIFIDDYAHHPTEIHAFLSSVKLLFPEKKITCIFQPHLYTRTRDFFDGFATELNIADRVIVMPIYPAREKPIPGITSDALVEKIGSKAKLEDVSDILNDPEVLQAELLLTIGAGDIDRIVPKLKEILAS